MSLTKKKEIEGNCIHCHEEIFPSFVKWKVFSLIITALAFGIVGVLTYTNSIGSEAASIRNLEQVEKRYQAADTAIIKQVDRVIDKIDDIQKRQSINHREVLKAIRER